MAMRCTPPAVERPILFSGPMVRAILAGRKTQTRRIVKPQPTRDGEMWGHANLAGLFAEHVFGACMAKLAPCPYGVTGDRLWLRETLGVTAQGDCEYMADGKEIEDPRTLALCERYGDRHHFCEVKGIPSIFMPRWACRLVLEVTDVRVERLQAISEADAIAEGCPAVSLHDLDCASTPPSRHYRELWDSLNAQRGCGWNVNPWVWVITFKKSG
jgi:hypothetical protein